MTADSASYPERHRALANQVAGQFALPHLVIQTGELERPEYRANPVNRCYYCKHELYTHLTALARDRGFAVVFDGNNADDRGDYRPGRQAAKRIRRAQPARRSGPDQSRDPRAVAPRRHADVGRAGVGVPVVADSVSQRSHGREAAQIEQAEEILHGLGFRVCRVRHHDKVARIEIGARRDGARARARGARRDRAIVQGDRLSVRDARSRRATGSAA